jgi:integrase
MAAELQLTVIEDLHPLLLMPLHSKDIRSRVEQFVAWSGDRHKWWQPDLARYRDDLLEYGLAPSSVSAYVGSVRGQYNKLLTSNELRDRLYAMTDPAMAIADRYAIVEEMSTRLRNAVHPSAAVVRLTKVQDEADTKHLRLTSKQAARLMASPDTSTLLGLRDAAVIALLLCTGIREGELCALDVSDLWGYLGGEPALLVRHGKGDKQRLVPYGDLIWCRDLVGDWMHYAEISEGAVFRGMTRGSTAREKRLTTRSVQRIVRSYPIKVRGQWVEVRPHDLRRTYARLMYEAGVDLMALQQNLGHTKPEITQGYIGQLDGSARRARDILHYNEERS